MGDMHEIDEKLSELVPQYGKLDTEIKTLKKDADKQKDEIKNLMIGADMTKCSYGGYVVSKVVSHKDTLDEAKALEILKKDWAERYGSMECPYIRTVEVIDMDALESVIYADELPSDTLKALDGCRTTTEIVSLKCAKAKEEKKDE